ncbi:MAG: saccharopine dehydrogenase NADP-binding domain-containing protein [Acidobacteria bacterium]|jgi:lysine 6-dehydrogenase|nr:saccharopine dehydrogenase NADP-binding domain-containing protein [Acidobacteriota bacterium]
MKVIVLGAGRVGEAIVKDLADSGRFEVTAADLSQNALESLSTIPGVTIERADLAAPGEIARLVTGQDIAVGAVPGPMGFATLGRVIETGVDVVDISFFEEEPWSLNQLATDRGVTAVMDCGVAPGSSSLILGRIEASWERVDAFRCYVGGLPVARHWPYEYKAVFSPIDVIAEYTRPARFKVNGEIVTMPALTEVEHLDFEEIGTLEAFNTDGLRTLLKTSKVPDMIEKTLRYPGHSESMRMLANIGFFSEESLEVEGVPVRPVDLTAKLLIPAWQLDEGDKDLTVLRVEVEGLVEGEHVVRRYDLLDRYDSESNITSMARTTGYTCTAMVNALAEGLYPDPGLSPPELVGRNEECFFYIFDYLAARGVRFEVTEQML